MKHSSNQSANERRQAQADRLTSFRAAITAGRGLGRSGTGTGTDTNSVVESSSRPVFSHPFLSPFFASSSAVAVTLLLQSELLTLPLR